jgi:Ca2+-transporting ATPase
MLLSGVALIALAIGIYQDFGPENHGSKSHWIEGVAIIIAVVIVSMVGSINDFQKEKQFQKLNAKKENRNIKVIHQDSGLGTQKRISQTNTCA